MTHNLLTFEELDALNVLIDAEQSDIINDEENEFWNNIRRKLTVASVIKPPYTLDSYNAQQI